jgi:hypothetical protein
VRIVTAIAGVRSDEARSALVDSDWRPKVASIVAACGTDPAAATELLEQHNGRLRDALEAARAQQQATRRPEPERPARPTEPEPPARPKLTPVGRARPGRAAPAGSQAGQRAPD